MNETENPNTKETSTRLINAHLNPQQLNFLEVEVDRDRPFKGACLGGEKKWRGRGPFSMVGRSER